MLPDSVREQLRSILPAYQHRVEIPLRIAAIDKIVEAAKLKHPNSFVSYEEDCVRCAAIDLREATKKANQHAARYAVR